MRVIVCGGRAYGLEPRQFGHGMEPAEFEAAHAKAKREQDRLYGVLDQLAITDIATGGATGADSLAHDWAWKKGTPCKTFFADWDKHGKAAGPIRNQQMLDEFKPDAVIAFPGGRGTADMVRRARAAGVRVVEGEA